jgi:hypothetical protein
MGSDVRTGQGMHLEIIMQRAAIHIHAGVLCVRMIGHGSIRTGNGFCSGRLGGDIVLRIARNDREQHYYPENQNLH